MPSFPRGYMQIEQDEMKQIITRLMQTKNRQSVKTGIELNRKYRCLTLEQMEELITNNWDHCLIYSHESGCFEEKVWTAYKWEHFLYHLGCGSSSGPTVDEWYPKQLHDVVRHDCFEQLDGYIAMPHMNKEEGCASDRPHFDQDLSLSVWAGKVKDSLVETHTKIVRWLEKQPEIVSFGQVRVWGGNESIMESKYDPPGPKDKLLTTLLQISVDVDIDLQELIMQGDD